MVKKFVVFGIALVMLFSLAGLSACDFGNGLVEYKATVITALEAYAESKGECNYCKTNWAEIQNIVAEGKTAINVAMDKAGVDSARETAKDEINAVGKFNENSHESLEFLSSELQKQIKQDYFETKIKPLFQNAMISDVKISRYYGSYYYQIYDNEDEVSVVVVMLSSRFDDLDDIIINGIYFWEQGSLLQLDEAITKGLQLDYNAIRTLHSTDLDLSMLMKMKGMLPNYSSLLKYYGTYNNAAAVIFSSLVLTVPSNETISGLTFYYPDGNKIRIFKDDTFFWLQEAYDLELLTVADLSIIHNIHNA